MPRCGTQAGVRLGFRSDHLNVRIDLRPSAPKGAGQSHRVETLLGFEDRGTEGSAIGIEAANMEAMFCMSHSLKTVFRAKTQSDEDSFSPKVDGVSAVPISVLEKIPSHLVQRLVP